MGVSSVSISELADACLLQHWFLQTYKYTEWHYVSQYIVTENDRKNHDNHEKSVSSVSSRPEGGREMPLFSKFLLQRPIPVSTHVSAET